MRSPRTEGQNGCPGAGARFLDGAPPKVYLPCESGELRPWCLFRLSRLSRLSGLFGLSRLFRLSGLVGQLQTDAFGDTFSDTFSSSLEVPDGKAS